MKAQALRAKKIRVTPNKIKTVKNIIIATISFILIQAKILGSFSPFAIAFTAGMPMKYSYITYIGTALSLLVDGLTKQNIIYLITLTIIMLTKFLFNSNKIKNRQLLYSINCFIVFSVVNIVAYISLDLTSIDLLLRLCETVIGAAFTYITYTAASVFLNAGKIHQYDTTEKVSVILILMTVVVALASVKVSGFNVGVAFGTICLLFSMYKLGVYGGAIGGILLGVSLTLYNVDFIYLSGILIVAGFMAGMFRDIGRIGQVAVFLSIVVFGVFVVGINLTLLFNVVDIIVAASIFLIFPKNILKTIVLLDERKENDRDIKGNLGSRLSFAAGTILDLQNSLEMVSDKLNRLSSVDVAVVHNKTAAKTCKNCGLNIICWDEQYNDTVDGFNKILQIIRKRGIVSVKEVEDKKIINCCRIETLVEGITKNYTEFLYSENDKRQKNHARKLVVEQLSGISHMLSEVSEEIYAIQENDKESAQIVQSLFEDYSSIKEDVEVFCTINKYGRMEIDIYLKTNVELLEDFVDELSRFLKRDFDTPCVCKTDNQVKISIYEKANFIAEFEAFQQNNQNEVYCGDSYDSFLDSKGNFYVVLSDGMGSGNRAALDSTMTCSMIMKLIKAGLGLESIIKFVNSSLQAKSTDESLSTIDIAKFDLYTGEVDFYKAGSASSFVMMDNSVVKVNTNSLPVGILQGIEFEHKSLTLKENDIVVMLSDGAMMDENELMQSLKLTSKKDVHEISEYLSEIITNQSEAKDDITLLVIKIQKGV